MENKSVVIEFLPSGEAEISYFKGNANVGHILAFRKVPKRLKFFLDKFPDDASKPMGRKVMDENALEDKSSSKENSGHSTEKANDKKNEPAVDEKQTNVAADIPPGSPGLETAL